MRVRPLEVKGILPLLEQDWPDLEDEESGLVIMTGQERLATAIIQKLDAMRRDRVDYVNVYSIGPGAPTYLAVGPYPGIDSARKARNGHLSALEATRYATVPLRSDEGFRIVLSDLDMRPEGSKDWAEVKRDAQAFKNGWRGNKSGRREDYLSDYLGRG